MTGAAKHRHAFLEPVVLSQFQLPRCFGWISQLPTAVHVPSCRVYPNDQSHPYSPKSPHSFLFRCPHNISSRSRFHMPLTNGYQSHPNAGAHSSELLCRSNKVPRTRLNRSFEGRRSPRNGSVGSRRPQALRTVCSIVRQSPWHHRHCSARP